MTGIGTIRLQTPLAGQNIQAEGISDGCGTVVTQPPPASGTGELLREASLHLFIKIKFLKDSFVVNPQYWALGRPALSLNTTATTPKEGEMSW